MNGDSREAARAGLAEKLQRHRDFWARRPVSRPLFGFCRPLGRSAPGFDLLGDRALVPADVSESLYQAYRDCHTVCTPCADDPGDLFYTTIPHCGIPWYEVMTGCPAHFSAGTLMAWAGPFAADVREAVDRWRLPLAADDPWLEKLRFVLRRRRDDFPGVPVPTVLGRGLLDLLLAAAPAEAVMAALVEEPDTCAAAMESLADMAIMVIAEQLSVLGPFHGGWSNRRGLWAPGSACWSQEDGAGLVGPSLFRELVMPPNRRLWASVDYPMFHTHSAGLPVMVEALLQAPELACVECTVDAGGPSLEELLPLWRRVLEAGKCLLVCLEESSGEVDRVVAALPPAGLAISVSGPDPAAFHYLLR